jgi:hypothetical protein
LWLVFLLILLAQAGHAAEPAPPPLACPEIPGIDPLLKKGQILLLGEMHGSAEIPAFVATAVCQGLRAGHSVTVGLEIWTEEEARIAAYLASGGKPEDRTALLAGPFWQDVAQDGRRSQAMLGLLEDVRRLRQEGRKVRVKLIDRLPKGPERDRAMAQELLSAVEAAPEDLFLVLTGNLHSRTARGTPWNPDLENMGFLVAQRHPGVVALDNSYSGGTIWMCPSADPADCGVKPLRGKGEGQPLGVKLYEKVSKEGYHGEFHVGALTASPPAARP